jgi:hypothetical protein
VLTLSLAFGGGSVLGSRGVGDQLIADTPMGLDQVARSRQHPAEVADVLADGVRGRPPLPDPPIEHGMEAIGMDNIAAMVI